MNREIIDKYLDFLGLNKKISTFEDIKILLQKHAQTFPFSSFKVLTKDDISLELDDIVIDFIQRKRSGYCFEHNKLIYETLKSLGFDVEFYIARMINNSKKTTPFTHRFTLLNLNGEKYLIDISAGFLSPLVPIKFGEGIKTFSHLDLSYTIKELEYGEYELNCLQENMSEYVMTRFNLQRCYEIDFEMGHFYTMKEPSSILANNLIMSLSTKDEIRSLRNNIYFKIFKSSKKKIEIKSFNEFKGIIKIDFNCRFTESELISIYEKYILKVKL